MGAPLILVIDSDADGLRDSDAALRARYSQDYRIVCTESPSVPGVFAAGDLRSGSVKRVASAVGEGSVAIQMLHQLFAADHLSADAERSVSM